MSYNNSSSNAAYTSGGSTPQLIHYVDAIASGGKTYAAIDYVAHRVVGINQKFLMVMPSKTLIEQCLTDMKTRFPEVPCVGIVGPLDVQPATPGLALSVPKPTVEIIKHLTASMGKKQGEVLMITHAAFAHLASFRAKDEWRVICDEIPTVAKSESFTITSRYFAGACGAAIIPKGPIYGDLVIRHRAKLVRWSKRKTPEGEFKGSDDQFAALAQAMIAPYWKWEADQSQWAAMRNNITQANTVNFFATLSPDVFKGWKSVCIMGADFCDSLLFRLWARAGVVFAVHTKITSMLRSTEHTNGHLLTIHYGTEANWSKFLRDKKSDAGAFSVGEFYRDAALKVLDGASFALLKNVMVQNDFFGPTATILPNTSHGLNCFQHIHNAVSFSALNPTTAFFKWLDTKGVSGDEVRAAGYQQTVYQSVMRTSLRNPADMNPKQVIVPDMATAEWLAGKFPGADVKQLPVLIAPPNKTVGRKRVHLSDAAKSAACRDKTRLMHLVDLAAANGLLLQTPKNVAETVTIYTKIVRTNRNAFGSKSGPLHGISIFNSIYDTYPNRTLPWMGHDAFIEDLRSFCNEVYADKTHNALMSPSLFNPAASSTTKRGRKNVVSSIGIMLDNDGGGLTKDEFAAMFPALRMAIFNSYSSTPEMPRWRVFVPTSVALDSETYRFIAIQILATLDQKGYRDKAWVEANGGSRCNYKSHGFDRTKFAPENMFYLPCKAGCGDSGSFFVDYNDRGRDVLDVIHWIENPAIAMRPEPDHPAYVPPAPETPVITPGMSAKLLKLKEAIYKKRQGKAYRKKEERVTEAIEKWRSACMIPGIGNDAFYYFGQDLAYAGCDENEISNNLHIHVVNARSEAERRKAIPYILRSLARNQRINPIHRA